MQLPRVAHPVIQETLTHENTDTVFHLCRKRREKRGKGVLVLPQRHISSLSWSKSTGQHLQD